MPSLSPAATLQANGFVHVPALINPLTCLYALEIAAAHDKAMRHNGALRLSDISPDLPEFLCTKALDRLIGGMIGDYAFLPGDWTNIFIFSDHDLKPTIWHQEAATVPPNSLICWVNLTEGAGVTAPGLGVVKGRWGNVVHEILNDFPDEAEAHEAYLAGYEQVFPHYGVGDVVVMNRYTPHKTHIAAEMTKPRVAFKLTVRAV